MLPATTPNQCLSHYPLWHRFPTGEVHDTAAGAVFASQLRNLGYLDYRRGKINDPALAVLAEDSAVWHGHVFVAMRCCGE